MTIPGGYQIATITANGRPDLELIRAGYREIYEEAFPIRDERESLETFCEALTAPSDEVRYIINILGWNLNDPEQRKLGCFGVANYYPQQDVGLLAYVATLPEYQIQGLAKITVNRMAEDTYHMARQFGGTLRGLFGEVNDPDKVSADEDSFDPHKRLAMYIRWGYQVVPIDYVQPALGPGQQKFEGLKLLNIPHPATGDYAGPKAIAAFIDGIYRELGADPDTSPDVARMYVQLSELA